jgi:hypothetical protein
VDEEMGQSVEIEAELHVKSEPWRFKGVTYLLVFAFILAIVSCSPVRSVRPLEKGQSAVSLSLGGPITQVGKIYLPLPMLCLGYNYGLFETMDIEGGINFTDMLFGIANIEAGANWRPLFPEKFRPGFIVSPRLLAMTDFKPGESRVYPDIGLTAFWKIRKQIYWYVGSDTWIELDSTRDDGNTQKRHLLVAPYIGTDFGNDRWRFQAEFKLYTPNLSNKGRPAKNIGAGDKGIFGVFLGVSRYFGNKK